MSKKKATRERLPIEQLFDSVKVLGTTKNNGIRELTHFEIDERTAPEVDHATVTIAMILSARQTVGLLAEDMLPGIWQDALPYIVEWLRSELRNDPPPTDPHERGFYDLAMKFDALTREALLQIFEAMTAIHDLQMAMNANDKFRIASSGILVGEAMFKLNMHCYQRSVKAGQGSRQGAQKGGESRKISLQEKKRTAREYKSALAAMMKLKPDLKSQRTLATDRVGEKFGVSGRHVRDYLNLLK